MKIGFKRVEFKISLTVTPLYEFKEYIEMLCSNKSYKLRFAFKLKRTAIYLINYRLLIFLYFAII